MPGKPKFIGHSCFECGETKTKGVTSFYFLNYYPIMTYTTRDLCPYCRHEEYWERKSQSELDLGNSNYT